MKRLLAAWMLLVQLALCWTIGLAEDAFEKETYYIHNDEMNRSIYAVQIKPRIWQREKKYRSSSMSTAATARQTAILDWQKRLVNKKSQV